MKEVPLKELVLDFDLYPRQQIDSQHVSRMCEAEKAGTKFPPIKIDKRSRRIVDGFHRFKKQQRVYGADAKIAVIEVTYASEAEIFLDALGLNAGHGRALTSFDRAHAVILAEKFGIDDEPLAAALLVSVEKVATLRVKKSAMAKIKGMIHLGGSKHKEIWGDMNLGRFSAELKR